MNLEMIQAAATRLHGHARHTPLLSAPLLDRIARRRVWVKVECLRWTGSFKFRGGWAAVSALAAGTQGGDRVFLGQPCAGSGTGREPPWFALRDRHALGRAQGEDRQHPCLGAEVVLHDREKEDRNAIGAALAAERGLVLIKPFDNAEVIAGQGSTGLEIAQDFDGGEDDAQVLTC